MNSEIRNRRARSKTGKIEKIQKVTVEKAPSNPNINEEESTRDDHSESERTSETDDNENREHVNDNKIKDRPKMHENCIAIPLKLNFTFEIDLISIALFTMALCTRFYRLAEPKNIVFDELHYGKYVSLYLKRTFFFDQHPPLGKQLVAAAAYLVGFDGNHTFSQIGARYGANVPIFWMRFVPALCGSLLVPLIYHLLVQLKLSKLTAVIGGVLIICENALVTQSQFILMEPVLLVFSVSGILLQLKFQALYDKLNETHLVADRMAIIISMLFYGVMSAVCFACALCVKYVAFYSCLLGIYIAFLQLWKMLGDRINSNFEIGIQFIFRAIIFFVVPVIVYLTIFRIHLTVLSRAGPHDSAMTSAFQASLEGGLASITKGQPLNVAHGSQITLRHTHGRTCWLHSHAAVYPVRYADKRGSSHQQQVTCYSFKDVNNWWIVKRPKNDNLVVDSDSTDIDVIRHGDEIQFIHGITSRALNSHDVASAMTPQSQEVSCYIDYNISMAAQILWKVDIINRASEGDIWHTIKSHVRLVHIDTGAALRFSGRQLPDWGFNQHEVVADRNLEHLDAIWNVEEHRYTKTSDQRERERQMVTAEMIPTQKTTLTFLEKFFELQFKMLWTQSSDSLPSNTHMYSSEPLEWPFLGKGIAYWVDGSSNAQIHLIGNLVIWYSGTFALIIYFALLVIYLLRRRRRCFDIDECHWTKFCKCGEILFVGYLLHFIPYFFYERTLFLHHYLPALVYKIMLLCFIIEHINDLLKQFFQSKRINNLYKAAVAAWLLTVLYVFRRFSLLTYGLLEIDGRPISADDIIALRWKDTWDFIIHKELS